MGAWEWAGDRYLTRGVCVGVAHRAVGSVLCRSMWWDEPRRRVDSGAADADAPPVVVNATGLYSGRSHRRVRRGRASVLG